MYSFPKINHTTWKPAARKTLMELVAGDKLTRDQILAILFSGKVSKISVRRALRKLIRTQKTIEAQMTMVKRFSIFLHDVYMTHYLNGCTCAPSQAHTQKYI